MEYYSAMKKNEIMPFAATWMDIEIIILKIKSNREKQMYEIGYVWHLKNDTSELMYKTEIDSQTEKINMVFQGEGRQRNKLGAWNEHIHHTV